MHRPLPLLLLVACASPEPAPTDALRLDEEPSGDCHSADLDQAPPPTVALDGTSAVPLDLLHVDAAIALDAGRAAARGQATVHFRMGPHGGQPFFDLRQTLTSATLDGQALPVSDLAPHAFTAAPSTSLRVFARDLAPCSEHVLELTWDLGVPTSDDSVPVDFSRPGAARWDLEFTDLRGGRYLEQWLPANLLYDSFAVDLDLEVVGGVPHTLVTNAEVEPIAEGRWSLSWPEHSTSNSPMIVLRPKEELSRLQVEHTLPDGVPVQVELVVPTRDRDLLARQQALLDELIGYLDANVRTLGPYPGGDRYTAVVGSRRRAMEYDAGTTTHPDALRHEVFHAWVGRGLRPATATAGWWDEAWTVHALREADAEPLIWQDDPPFTLEAHDPFARRTPPGAYGHGSAVFDRLAREVGEDRFGDALVQVLAERGHDALSTRDLETALYCATGHSVVPETFWRWVYGQEGPVPIDAVPACP